MKNICKLLPIILPTLWVWFIFFVGGELLKDGWWKIPLPYWWSAPMLTTMIIGIFVALIGGLTISDKCD
jgi:hypothetical protein